MSTFQPPPTYADVVLVDPQNKMPARFNPIWLKWFLDLSKNIGGGGAASVVSVSVTTANGISGAVANPTTTPAITLALAAITPTTVRPSSGYKAVDGSNGVSGSFTSADSKTITVKNGVITAIV